MVIKLLKHLLIGMKKENKCIAGFVLIGSVDGGKKEEITVSGEVLNFLSTGIDTRVYFIKNF